MPKQTTLEFVVRDVSIDQIGELINPDLIRLGVMEDERSDEIKMTLTFRRSENPTITRSIKQIAGSMIGNRVRVIIESPA